MGENVFLRKEELESVEPIWEEETLTSFARGNVPSSATLIVFASAANPSCMKNGCVALDESERTDGDHFNVPSTPSSILTDLIPRQLR